jgi:hypothetical protein
VRQKVQKTRVDRPHADILYGAKVLLRFSSEEREGRYYEWMGALLLSAFAFEGYLNYLGRKLFSSWESFERFMRWDAKVMLVADDIGFKLDKSQPPFQTVQNLFAFRNNVAHLKPNPEMREEHETDTLDFTIFEPIKTEVEKFCNEVNARRCIEDVEKMIKLFHKQAKVGGGDPLQPGHQSGSVTPANPPG